MIQFLYLRSLGLWIFSYENKDKKLLNDNIEEEEKIPTK